MTSQVAELNMVDAHTGVQVVWPIRKPLASVTSDDVLIVFELGWGSWGPPPGRFSADAGKDFEGILEQFCASMGVPKVKAGTEAHWQAGSVEIHGGVWKSTFMKLAIL